MPRGGAENDDVEDPSAKRKGRSLYHSVNGKFFLFGALVLIIVVGLLLTIRTDGNGDGDDPPSAIIATTVRGGKKAGSITKFHNDENDDDFPSSQVDDEMKSSLYVEEGFSGDGDDGDDGDSENKEKGRTYDKDDDDNDADNDDFNDEEEAYDDDSGHKNTKVRKPKPSNADNSDNNNNNDNNNNISPEDMEDRHPADATIRAFRSLSLDWHDLAKESTAEMEARVLNHLHSKSGHGAHKWGTNFGDRSDENNMYWKHQGCKVYKDQCAIHSGASQKELCLASSFCGYCEETEMCHDMTIGKDPSSPDTILTPVSKRSVCPAPLQTGVPKDKVCSGGYHVSSGGALRPGSGNRGECNHYIHEEYRVGDTAGDANMLFHFLQEFKPMVFTQSLKSHKTHVFYSVDPNDHPHKIKQFSEWFSIVSDFCPRPLAALKDGLCFCSDPNSRSGGGERYSGGDEELITAIVERLKLQDVRPSNPKGAIGLISRLNKRFILNELEMADIARERGMTVTLLPFESMTLYEQVNELRKVNFLIGIHGSGLCNAMFLYPQTSDFTSALVQIVPYKVIQPGVFFMQSVPRGAKYIEHLSTNPKLSVFHWHFLKDGLSDAEKADRLAQGPHVQNGEFFSFWINQDVIVDTNEWRKLLDTLTKKE